MQDVDVHCIATRGPGDAQGLLQAIEGGIVAPQDIVAILGKTEGNGCVNDFTREFAQQALAAALAGPLGLSPAQVMQRIAFVMSGGTEGVLSPHLTVFCRRRLTSPDADRPGNPDRPQKRLGIGIAFTRDFAAQEIGRLPQIQQTAVAVTQAMADAGIDQAQDVHFVQIKCPLLTAECIAAARAAGAEPVTTETYQSMAYSRGASALGVAIALGELAPDAVGEHDVLSNWSLYSTAASASAGIELQRNVVIVMGMSVHSRSRLIIDHSVMRDAIDADALRRCLARLGIGGAGGASSIVGIFAKAEASPDGHIRGVRHTMLGDSDLHATRHARAAVGGVVASVVGHTLVYVSGGAEHQGPAGGGPFAVIARV